MGLEKNTLKPQLKGGSDWQTTVITTDFNALPLRYNNTRSIYYI